MFPERAAQTVCAQRTRWPSYQPMVLVFLSFALGVGLDRALDWNWQFSAVAAWSSLIGWYGCRTYFRHRSDSSSVQSGTGEQIASTLLLIGLVFAGAFWHHGRWNWFGANEIGRFAPNVSVPCCIDATVISEPHWTLAGGRNGAQEFGNVARTRLTVCVNRIRDGEKWINVSGVVDLVIHETTNKVMSGDQVRVFGRLVASTPPSNPGQFDFQSFYRAKSKLAFLHAYESDSVFVLRRVDWIGVRLLSFLRHRLNEITWKYVNDEEAGFASAILLGNREQLSNQRRNRFLETGTVHLLAISGLHVGILAGSFFLFFRMGLVSRRKCLWLTILFVIFYAWLVEFRPPASRAAILVSLFCCGRLWGERSFSFNLLAIAGLVVLLINPNDLFGLGPQLSFLAVASLTFGSVWVFWPPSRDPIQRLIASTRPWHVRCWCWTGRQLRTAILVSGLIWMVAMPLVAYRFHLVAPIALVINPLLLVPIAWGLYGGLGVLVFGWFLPPAAIVCGWVCHRNLALIEWMIGAAQAVPLGHVWTAGPASWAVIVFYAGMFLFAVCPLTRLPGKWIAGLAFFWLVSCWIAPDQIANQIARRGENPLVCTFIDVGHGSSVLLQFPSGQNMLYDAGSFGAAEYGARSVAGVLWSERIKRLDAVVISHADVDHFNALPYLADRFSIGKVYISPQMSSSDSGAVVDLLDALDECGAEVKLISQDDRLLPDSGVAVTMLGPPESGNAGNDNSNSVVLLFEFRGRKVLLPGDLEQAGLDRLLASDPINTDLVMAAHHGSRNSQPQAFMKWSTPEYVVISGGSHRLTEELINEFEPTRRNVRRTDVDGAIRFSIDNSGDILLEEWNSNPWD